MPPLWSRLRLVNRPLTRSELAAAAELLPTGAAHWALAAVAIPAGRLPDAEVAHTRGGLCWRGHVLTRWDDPDAVAEWASAAWEECDVAAVPAGPLWDWVRPVRSGSRVVFFGPGTLWPAAWVSAALDVDEDLVVELLRRWWEGEPIDPPAVFTGRDGEAVLVDGDRDWWRIRPVDDVVVVDLREIGDSEVASLVASAAEAESARSWNLRRYVGDATRWSVRLDLGDWEAHFDLRTHHGAVQIVAPPLGLATAVPPGWEPVPESGSVMSPHGLVAAVVPKRSDPGR